MIKKDEILSFLRERKDELFSEYQLVKIGLFGSFARNERTDAHQNAKSIKRRIKTFLLAVFCNLALSH